MLRLLYACLLALSPLALNAQEAAWWNAQAPGEPLLTMPMDPAAAAEQWEGTDNLTLVDDEELGRQVLSPAKRQIFLASRERFEGDVQVDMLMRWPDRFERRTYGMIFIGAEGHPARPTYAYRVVIRPTDRSGPTLQVNVDRGSIANNLVDQAPRSADGRAAYFRYRFRDISPVWDPEFRTEVEQATAAVPPPDTTWFRLRVLYQDGNVSIFKDGYCVGRYEHNDRIAGQLIIGCYDEQMRIGALSVTRPDDTGAYTPVTLNDRVNAGSAELLSADSLPPAGARIAVDGVPFELPDRLTGNDHIDIGQSLFHYRNFEGSSSMRILWPSPFELDANRIFLNIPNRPYRRAWLLAAADADATEVPMLTLRVVKPQAGWPIDATAEVPTFTAGEGARRLPVKAPDGSDRSLWLIPIDLDAQAIASEYRHEDTLMVELTKQVYPFRSYPDPSDFGWFQGGPASAVRLFGLTFESAPVSMIAKGNRPGNAFVLPDAPSWDVDLTNHSAADQSGTLTIEVTDPYGTRVTAASRPVQLLAGETRTIRQRLQPELLGLHTVTSTFTPADGDPVTYDATFVQLPLDSRRTNQASSRWGLWTWYGAHGTNPDPIENAYLLRAAGARGPGPGRGEDAYALRRQWGLFPRPVGLAYRAPRWMFSDPDNEEKIAEFRAEVVEKAKKTLEASPDNPFLAVFVEDVADIPLMFGEYPKFLGKEGTDSWSEEQKHQYEIRFKAGKIAFEAIREALPKAQLSLGWTHPQFQVPLLRMGFPSELFDVVGVDFPTFMRMAEMPIRDIAAGRMWLLQEEMDRLGYGDKPVVHHESIFPTSHELSLGHRTSADYYVRYGTLMLLQGSDRLLHCFSLHDCSGYWGSQHYGSIGIVGRYPMYNPKPAFAAYSTMTNLLDFIVPDGFIETGSLSSYCLRFRNRDTTRPWTYVQSLWSIRGERPATLTFAADEGRAVRIDENGNEFPIAITDGTATVTLSPTPFWIVSEKPIEAMTLGEPTYTEAPQGPVRELAATFANGWSYSSERFARLEENNAVLAPYYAGPMELETRTVDGQDELTVTLKETPEERPTVDWYGVLEPEEPIVIPGMARALGLYVNANSSQGRVIYEIEDAKGERWLSTGAPENWNGDDSAQRSYFNFDGYRYVEFPLPRNHAYDGYRDYENVWWGYDQDGIVDLPIKLTKVIITHRTHHMYVNQLVEVPNRSVLLDRLVAVYESEAAMSSAPVERQQLATYEIEPPRIDLLPNPISDLQSKSELAPPRILRFYKPDDWYDGTQIMVELEPVEEAARGYNIYVSAHESGAGAKRLASGTDPAILVRRLRPEYPLYFFATYTAQNRQESKPSEVQPLLLKDDFPNK